MEQKGQSCASCRQQQQRQETSRKSRVYLKVAHTLRMDLSKELDVKPR